MAGGLGNACQQALLLLLFNNTTWANIGNTAGLVGSSVAGSFYSELSTGTLTAASSQNTTEAAYTNYARQAVSRGPSGWSISGSSPTQSANAAAVTFPLCGTYAGETETYHSVGRDASGAGMILWLGPLLSPLLVGTNVQPSFAIAALVAQIQ
jgi:hypothetical protein